MPVASLVLDQTFPENVQLAEYNWGTSFLALGTDTVSATLDISIVLGDPADPVTPSYIVWAATGAPFLPFSQSLSGVSGAFQLPTVDQDGYLAPNGNSYKNWHYLVRLRYTFNNQSVEIDKILYPQTGQAPQDLDAVIATGEEGGPIIELTNSVTAIRINGVTYQPDVNGLVDLGEIVGSGGGGGDGTDQTARDSAAAAQGRANAAYDLADSKYTLANGTISAARLVNSVQTSLGLADTSYQKPAGGIPATDLTAAGQTSLQKADSSYQKPVNGISTNDLSQTVINSLNRANTSTQPADLTKAAVGLSDVSNLTPAAMPVSQATQTALDNKAPIVGGLIPTQYIPAIALMTVVTVNSRAAMLALNASQVQPGDIAVDTSNTATRGSYILSASDPSQIANWVLLNTPLDVVQSVNGQSGTVVLGKTDVGLGNVDNTTDLNKPISTATQTALNAKASQTDLNTTNTAVASKANQSDLTTTNQTVATKANQSDLNATNATLATKPAATLGAKGSTPPAGTPVGFYLTRAA